MKSYMAMLAACMVMATGCLHLRPMPRAPGAKMVVRLAPAADCAGLERRVVGLTVSSVAAGALGGAGGGIAPYADADAVKYSLAGVGAGLSAFSAIASYLATHYA